MDRKFKILCFVDKDYGRDVEIILPVAYCAEKYLNCTVSYALNFDLYQLKKKKPDLVLIANAIGSHYYYEISKIAHENGVKVFALISEGNYRTDGTFDIWGYNSDKFIYQDYVCHWSGRTQNFLRKQLPEYAERMVLTGATGFDRYKIYDFMTKTEFLERYNKSNFKRLICYAGWAFGKIYNKQGLEELSYFTANLNDSIQWIKKNRTAVESILKHAIEANPDILFVLKRHPNEANPSIVVEHPNEMNGLTGYPNVVYVKEEINIHDLINIADIWLAFESTTNLEFWLRKPEVPTILVNPDPEFNRDELYKGSIIIQNQDELQLCIDEFYTTNRIDDFSNQSKQKLRENLIENTIGFNDGQNHIRAAIYLKKTLEKVNFDNAKKFKVPIKYRVRHLLLKKGQYFYNQYIFRKLPKFKKTIWVFENHKLKNLPILKQTYWKYLNSFHQKSNVEQFVKENLL